MNKNSIYGCSEPKFGPQLEMGIILKFTETASFFDKNGLFVFVHNSSITTLLKSKAKISTLL